MLYAPAYRLCIASTLLVAATAGAAEQDTTAENQDAAPGNSKSYAWGVGVVGLSQQQAYTDIDRFNIALPLIYFENRWVQLMGPWLDLKLPSLEWSDDYEFASGMRTQLFGFNDYEPDDAPILNGMAERKSGIFVGPFAKWRSPYVDVFGEAMFDVSGNSEGKRISMGLERQFHIGERFMLTPSVTATWMDEQYVDYYYGVRAREIRPDRPAYRPDGATNTQFSLRTDYMFDAKNSLFVMFEYTVLGDAIEDSPLVDSSAEDSVLLGYLYRF